MLIGNVAVKYQRVENCTLCTIIDFLCSHKNSKSYQFARQETRHLFEHRPLKLVFMVLNFFIKAFNSLLNQSSQSKIDERVNN